MVSRSFQEHVSELNEIEVCDEFNFYKNSY